MLASKYIVQKGGPVVFAAPAEVAEDPSRLTAQGREATLLLAALNTAVNGCQCCPFREIIVFNHEDE